MEKRITVVTGCFGSGKSEIAVQLALNAAPRAKVTLADLDIVNPYFTSSRQKEEMEAGGIMVVSPVFSGTGVEALAISPQLRAIFTKQAGICVVDLGGDATGATVLGSFANEINAQGADMLFVLNPYRPFTDTTRAALEMMRGIENKARVKVTGIINNANMVGETTPAHLAHGDAQCKDLAAQTGLPIVYHCGTQEILAQAKGLSGAPLALTLRNRPADIFG